ncbi:DUF350 domain-containing protein [Saccharothrix coeruleofusca]|uniref:DUF350 domain-containing protein n=1 Tax=Saccharothrix coeruleofusca TaxID=33919 RepID=A0A918EAV9_9PSEU|nr:DUF350 domain-containing protein [Saccharothrix coeruleofusca]MBP2340110.1 uncharacterized membrane protein YjfL (UPF0719 family) [Saccharothrix coeruleofusca]GGP37257.1 DUF350 domain-containing protein [Saccharothrix coeruleofusca]
MITEFALDPGFGAAIGRGVGAIALYAVVGLLLMVFGFYAIDWTTPGKLSTLVRTGAPNAVIVTAAGLFSMALIVVVAIYSSAGKLDEGLLSALVFGLVGIVVQVLAVRLLEWVTRLDIGSLIESDRFAPASAVVASAHVALGLVVAVAIS